MDKIILGTDKWRDVERWVEVCVEHGKKYILNSKESKIGFEKTWYELAVEIPDEHEKAHFMHDIHECWKPKRLRRKYMGEVPIYAGSYR